MNKLIFAIVTVIVVSNFSPINAQQTQVAQGAAMGYAPPVPISTQVDRPLKKVGDSCSYQRIDNWKSAVMEEYTLTISAISDNGHELVKKSKTGETLGTFKETLDLNALSLGETQYSPDMGYYSFPLYVGKMWEAKASYVKTNGSRGSYTLSAKVVGEEKIGELDTLKITYNGDYHSTMPDGHSGWGKMRITRWYAPSVGCTARTNYEDTNWAGSVYSRDTTNLMGYKAK